MLTTLKSYFDALASDPQQLEDLPGYWSRLPEADLETLMEIPWQVRRASRVSYAPVWAYLQKNFIVFDHAIESHIASANPQQILDILAVYKVHHIKPSQPLLTLIEQNIIDQAHLDDFKKLVIILKHFSTMGHVPNDETFASIGERQAQDHHNAQTTDICTLYRCAAAFEAIAQTDIPFSQAVNGIFTQIFAPLSLEERSIFAGSNFASVPHASLWFHGKPYLIAGHDIAIHSLEQTNSPFEREISYLVEHASDRPLKFTDPHLSRLNRATDLAFQIDEQRIHLEIDGIYHMKFRSEDGAPVYNGGTLFNHGLMQRLYPERVFVRLPTVDFEELKADLGKADKIGNILTQTLRDAAHQARQPQSSHGFAALYNPLKGLALTPL